MAVDISSRISQALTFVDILTQRAEQQSEQTAYTFLNFGKGSDTSLTYGELDLQVRAIAARLQYSGHSGKPVLLLYPPGLDYITAFLACLYAGAIAVPLYPPHTDRLLPRIQAIIDDTRATTALTTTKTLNGIERKFGAQPELQHLCWITTDDSSIAPISLNWCKPELDEHSLAFLQYTSGSTSTPKGVMVSHGNLYYNSLAIREQMGLSEQDCGVSWLPIFHDLGLIMGILQPLYTGYPTFLMAPAAFLQYPLRWLQTISERKATVSYAPNFAYELCMRRIGPEERTRLDLSHWQVALNGAEPIRNETLRRFMTTFGPCGFHPDTFMPAYGLAEATLLVSGTRRRSGSVVRSIDKTLLEQHRATDIVAAHPHALIAVGCGTEVRGQQIVVVHPESLTKCQSDEVGEIWITGSCIAQGYFHNEEATRQTFQAYLADTGEGPFLRTGDLGFIRDGEVFITGRLKDLIIINGRNHYPQDIECTVEQSSPIIRAGCTIAFPVEERSEEQLVVVAEVRLPQHGLSEDEVEQILQETRKAIRRNIAEAHEITAYQIKLVPVGGVPKTSSGKLQRRACRASYLAGDLREWQSGTPAMRPHTL